MASFNPTNPEEIYKWSIVEAYFQLLPVAYFSVDNIRRLLPSWPSPAAQRVLLTLLNPCNHSFLTNTKDDVKQYIPPLSYRRAVFRVFEKQIRYLPPPIEEPQEDEDEDDFKEVYADELVDYCMELLNESTSKVPSSAVSLYGDTHEDAAHIGYASYAVPFYDSPNNTHNHTEHPHRIPICIKKTFTQVGTKIWGAGLFLAEVFQYMTFLQDTNVGVWKDKVVLELGAGVGITGILIGRGLPVTLQPKRIILTDCFEEVMNILHHNIACLPIATEENRLCELIGDAIDWSTVSPEQIHGYEADCLIAADCTYSEDLNLLLIELFQVYLSKRTSSVACSDVDEIAQQRKTFLPIYLLQQHIPFVLIACTIRHPDTFEHFVKNLYAVESLQVYDVSEMAHELNCKPLYEYDFRSNIRLFCIVGKL